MSSYTLTNKLDVWETNRTRSRYQRMAPFYDLMERSKEKLYKLDRTPAATASLLLNFESIATAILAGLLFKEAIGKPIWWAVGLITLACIALSYNGGAWGFSIGAMGGWALASCGGWIITLHAIYRPKIHYQL